MVVFYEAFCDAYLYFDQFQVTTKKDTWVQ